MSTRGSVYSIAGPLPANSCLKPMMTSGHLMEELYQSAACLSQHRLEEAERLHACILDAGNKDTKRKTDEAMRKSFNLDLAL